MGRPKRPELHPRLAEFRRAASLTQDQVAERIGISSEMVRRHERGLAMPIPLYRDRYCAVFKADVSELWPPIPVKSIDVAPISGKPIPRENSASLLLPSHFDYADNEYLTAIHEHIGSVVNLDNRFGGTDLVNLSSRFFNSVSRQLGSGSFDKKLERDLLASAGELAEVTGWLAYDADDHNLVRRMNHESLHFSRLAGDRSMELFTLQNASMHAVAIGRPFEAMAIARSVLEGSEPLSPRLRALFLTRKARALALDGDDSAPAMFAEIRSLYDEGPAQSDPAWAWWIDERELLWQEAMAFRDAGQSGAALERFTASVEAGPSTGKRSTYIHQSYLAQAQLEANAWNDVATTVNAIEPFITDIASTRTVVLLRSVADGLRKSRPKNASSAETVRQATAHLDRALALAPV